MVGGKRRPSGRGRIARRIRRGLESASRSFGIAESTGQNKSKDIRDALRMGPLSPDWTLPSRLADNPMVWMLQVNGLMIDIRHTPLELQRVAYDKGLIPLIPAEQPEKPE